MDDELASWQRARAGDGAAFAELFRVHQSQVYRRALGLTGHRHDAEDVTAAAFFELWRKRRTVRLVNGTVLPWLLVTTLNLARNHSRGAARYRRVIADLPRTHSPDAEATALKNIEIELVGLRLHEALTGLSTTDAALLTLTALDGLSTAAAAEAIGLKPGTARMRLSRTRERLQTTLGQDRHILDNSLLEGDRS